MSQWPLALVVVGVHCVWAQNADFDGSGVVDLQDFFAFADVFGEEVTDVNSRFDLNSDGAIDLFDFFLFADQFGDKVPFSGDILTADLPGATMEFVWIEPGTFTMDSPDSEPGSCALCARTSLPETRASSRRSS